MNGVGISFGNTNAYISVWRGERSEVIANSAGERNTAALVANLEGDLVTGSPAVQISTRQPVNAVSCLKSMIGQKLENVVHNQACKLEQHNDEIIVNFSNVLRKGVSALVKCVFENLKETADSALGEGSHDAVIALPLSSSPVFISTMKKCATAAGFRVVGTVPDALAVLLRPESAPAEGNHAVVRVGGHTMSITLIHVKAGMYSVLDHVETQLGGVLFDKSVGKFLCEDFNRKNRCRVEENPRSMSKILRAAKAAKHNLSTLNTAECNIESLFDGIDLVTSLSRPRFETLIQNDLQKMRQVVDDQLAKHRDISIQRVYLSGGSCKVPKVQALLTSLFPHSSILVQTPDEEIALGAACHWATLSKHRQVGEMIDILEDGTVSVPVCPQTVSVRVGECSTVAIAEDTPLPHETDIEIGDGSVLYIETADGKCLVKAALAQSEEKCRIFLHLEMSEDLSLEGTLKDLSSNERTSFSLPGFSGA